MPDDDLPARTAAYLKRFKRTKRELAAYSLWWTPERMLSGRECAVIEYGDLRVRVCNYGFGLSFWEVVQTPPPAGSTFGKLDGDSCLCFEFGLTEAGEALLRRLAEKAEAAAAALAEPGVW